MAASKASNLAARKAAKAKKRADAKTRKTQKAPPVECKQSYSDYLTSWVLSVIACFIAWNCYRFYPPLIRISVSVLSFIFYRIYLVWYGINYFMGRATC